MTLRRHQIVVRETERIIVLAARELSLQRTDDGDSVARLDAPEHLALPELLDAILTSKPQVGSSLRVIALKLRLSDEGELRSLELELTGEGALTVAAVHQWFGLGAMPNLPWRELLTLRRLGFDVDSGWLGISGLVTTGHGEPSELALEVWTSGPRLHFVYRRNDGARLTVATLVGDELRAAWTEALPRGTLLDGLASSYLDELDLEFDASTTQLWLGAGGQLFGLAGRIGLSLTTLEQRRLVSLLITTDAKPEPIREVLARLGAVLDERVLLLPSIELALRELSFEQLGGRFRLAGRVHGGSGALAYELAGVLELDWSSGLAIDLDLDARQKPVTLAAFARDLCVPFDEIAVGLGDLGERLGRSAFHSLQFRLDTAARSVAFAGTAELFGALLVQISLAYAPDQGLSFAAEIHAEPFALGDVLELVGVDASRLSLPTLRFGMRAVEFSEQDRRLAIVGVVATDEGRAELGLAIRLADSVAVSLAYRSASTERITVADLVASSFPQLRSALPKGEFLDKLGRSSLARLELEIDTGAGEMSLLAEGDVLGLEGSVCFSVTRVHEQPMVSLLITGAPAQARSLPALLEELGIRLESEAAKAWLPRTRVALTELSFDQRDSSFRLAGLMAGGEGERAYELRGALELEWLDGVRVDLDLDASQKPVTLAAFAEDLHLPFADISNALGPIGDKIGASAFHSLAVRVDTGRPHIEVAGAASLFGEILVSTTVAWSRDEGLRFAARVYAEPIFPETLLGFVGVTGLSGLLPRVGLGLSSIDFDQRERVLAIAGLVGIGDKRADLKLDVTTRAHGGGAARFVFEAVPERGPSFVDFVDAIVPALEIGKLPLVGMLALSVDELDVLVDSDDASLLGTARGRLVLAGETIALVATNDPNRDERLSKPASPTAWLFSAKSQGELELTKILREALGETGLAVPRGLPELTVSGLDVCVNTWTRKVDLGGRASASISMPGLDRALELSFGLDISIDANGPTGVLDGALTFGPLVFDAKLTLAEQTQIETTLDCKLHAAIEALLGMKPPEGLPDVDLTLTLKVDTAGNFEISGKFTGRGEMLTLGSAQLDLDEVSFHLRRTTDTVNCTVGVAGSGALTTDVECEHFGLNFRYQKPAGQQADWGLDGDLKAKLFGEKLHLRASAKTEPGISTYSLSVDQAALTVGIEGVATMTLRTLGLTLTRGRASAWSFWATADIVVANPLADGNLIAIEGGRVELFSGERRRGLAFTAADARLEIRVGGLGFDLVLERLELAHQPSTGWSCGARVALALVGLPESIARHICKPLGLDATLDGNGLALAVESPFDPIEIPFPKIVFATDKDGRELAFDAGTGAIGIGSLKLTASRKPSFTISLVFGLPSKLNEIFGKTEDGTPSFELFNTYRRAEPGTVNETLIGLELGYGSETGFIGKLSGQPISPLRSAYVDVAVKDGWVTIDGNKNPNYEFGCVRLQLPTFSLKDGGLTFSGAFEIVDADQKPLKLPITLPIVEILKAAGEAEVAAAINEILPGGIPISSFTIFDENKKLVIPPKGVELPTELLAVVAALEDVLARVPDRLLSYLNFALPDKLKFSLDIAAGGAVSFRLETGEQPLKVLVPVIPAMQLVGMQIRGINFGTAFGGRLLMFDLDLVVDIFDMPTLIASLALPLDQAPLADYFPARKQLARTIFVEKLFTLVVVAQAGPVPVPIPIPLFYDHLGISSTGIEGVTLETHFYFPRPKFDFAEALAIITNFYKFCSQGDYFLPTELHPGDAHVEPGKQYLPKSLKLEFEVGDNYVELPKYLGLDEHGKRRSFGVRKGQIPKINAQQILNFGLNAIKKRSINALIQAVPLDRRLGVEQLSLFGALELDVGFALTTPAEFVDTAHPRLLALTARQRPGTVPSEASPADELFALFADRDDGEVVDAESEGLVLFMRGGLAIRDAALLEVAIAMMASGAMGFRTGLALQGTILDALDLRLLGFVKLSPRSQTDPVRVLGKTSMTLLGREVVSGVFELGKSHVELRGRLQLFPPGSPLQVNGAIDGQLNNQRFYLFADLEVAAGGARASATLLARSGHFESEGVRHELVVGFEIPGLRMGARLEARVANDERRIVDASVDVHAWNLIDLRGEMTLIYVPGQSLELSGRARVTLGPGQAPIARVGVWCKSSFDVRQGVLAIDGGLERGSFFLSPRCAIAGELALRSWFSGPEAGDFVLTVGGYHPAFPIPRHYPRPGRIRLTWPVDEQLKIEGSGYMALTPACVMLGGQLRATWEYKFVKAWFSADADFLISWTPFRYATRMSVGVVVQIDFLGRHRLQLSADVDIWGPEFTCRACFRAGPFTVTVRIGEGRPPPRVAMDWVTFRDQLLTTRRNDGSVAPLLELRVTRGLARDHTDNPAVPEIDWEVDAQDLQLSVRSKVPVKQAVIGDKPRAEALSPGTGVAPMNLTRAQLQSTQTITIAREGRDVTGEFVCEPIVTNAARAMWGESMEPSLRGEALVRDTVMGWDITPEPRSNEARPLVIEVAKLDDGEHQDRAFAWTDPATPRRHAGDALAIIRGSFPAARARRDQLAAAFGLAAGHGDLHLDTWAEALVCAPQVWEREGTP